MLLSANDIADLRCLLAAALRRGASALTICEILDRAISGLYSARSGFTRRDLDIALLVKSIGGPRLLYALQKSQGFASWRTVGRHHKIPKLLPSIGIPSANEIISNIVSFFDPSTKPQLTPAQNGLIPGNIVMVDGMALETRCRYCPKHDSILGLCREHSHNVDTKVISLDSIEKVHVALFESQDDATKVCFGSDATVVAIAPYARDYHYSPVPIVASPSDKHEKGVDLAKWLETILDIWKTHGLGEKKNGPIWALGTDGDASYRLAKQIICVCQQIDKSTPLGKLLSSLLGLNCYTSKDGLTGTCDPKHIIKRFATLLRCIAGFMINDANIKPSDIVDQLALLPNMSIEKAHQLSDPLDNQNVPKAHLLIQLLTGIGMQLYL